MSKYAAGNAEFFADSVTLPNDPGKGVKLGRYREISRFGWRDITAPIEVRGVAATDPTWKQIGSSLMTGYRFDVGDYVWQCFHIPHDIVPGSDIHFHAHWCPDGTDTNSVTWEWQYAYAKGFGQGVFDFELTESPLTNAGIVYASQAGPGTAFTHMVTETAAVTIPDLTEPDGVIYVRMGRVNNQTSPVANNADEIFVMTADVHYQSTSMATLGKAPNFYE